MFLPRINTQVSKKNLQSILDLWEHYIESLDFSLYRPRFVIPLITEYRFQHLDSWRERQHFKAKSLFYLGMNDGPRKVRRSHEERLDIIWFEQESRFINKRTLYWAFELIAIFNDNKDIVQFTYVDDLCIYISPKKGRCCDQVSESSFLSTKVW